MEKYIVIALLIFGFAIAVFEIYYVLRWRKGSVQQRIVVRSFLVMGAVLVLFVGLSLTLYIMGLIPGGLYWLMLGLAMVVTVFINIWANRDLKKVKKK